MIIKIDRTSIKRNPRAGATTSILRGPRMATFEFPKGGKIPANLLEKVEITEWRGAVKPEDGIHMAGYITDPDDCELIVKIPGITVRVDNNIQRVDHKPEPGYLYEHEDPAVTCGNCHEVVPVSEIGSDVLVDEDGEETLIDQICPRCGRYDTFGEIEYESIEQALKD